MSDQSLRDQIADAIERGTDHDREDFVSEAREVLKVLAEPDAATVERVARALFAMEEPDLNDFRWDKPQKDHPLGEFHWHEYWLHAAEAGLRAAFGGEQDVHLSK